MSDYYDPDHILITQTPLPVTFQFDVRNLGHLLSSDPDNSPTKHLKKGSKTHLPLWLAHTLFKKKFVQLSLPHTHSLSVRRELKANAPNASMKHNPHFYSLGTLLARSLPHDQDLPSILQETFKARFPSLLANAQNWRHKDSSIVTDPMSEDEKKLFEIGHNAFINYENWSHGKTNCLSISPTMQAILKNRKKNQAPH